MYPKSHAESNALNKYQVKYARYLNCLKPHEAAELVRDRAVLPRPFLMPRFLVGIVAAPGTRSLTSGTVLEQQ